MISFSMSFTSISSPAAFRAAVSIFETSMRGVISSKESSWLAANSLGLGYMGSPVMSLEDISHTGLTLQQTGRLLPLE
ncbi:MAG: hypothetical protein QXQ46_11655 [Thermoplasmatales archaeon]